MGIWAHTASSPNAFLLKSGSFDLCGQSLLLNFHSLTRVLHPPPSEGSTICLLLISDVPATRAGGRPRSRAQRTGAGPSAHPPCGQRPVAGGATGGSEAGGTHTRRAKPPGPEATRLLGRPLRVPRPGDQVPLCSQVLRVWHVELTLARPPHPARTRAWPDGTVRLPSQDAPPAVQPWAHVSGSGAVPGACSLVTSLSEQVQGGDRPPSWVRGQRTKCSRNAAPPAAGRLLEDEWPTRNGLRSPEPLGSSCTHRARSQASVRPGTSRGRADGRWPTPSTTSGGSVQGTLNQGASPQVSPGGRGPGGTQSGLSPKPGWAPGMQHGLHVSKRDPSLSQAAGGGGAAPSQGRVSVAGGAAWSPFPAFPSSPPSLTSPLPPFPLPSPPRQRLQTQGTCLPEC